MSHGLPLISLTMSQNKQYYEHQYAGRIIQSTFITHFTMQQCIIKQIFLTHYLIHIRIVMCVMDRR
jgi:hypothetical protein